jgi:hypothetical protein
MDLQALRLTNAGLFAAYLEYLGARQHRGMKTLVDG